MEQLNKDKLLRPNRPQLAYVPGDMIREIRQHLIQRGQKHGENREEGQRPFFLFDISADFWDPEFITGDFYSMPAIVAFLIALLAAFVQNRELGFAEKIGWPHRAWG